MRKMRNSSFIAVFLIFLITGCSTDHKESAHLQIAPMIRAKQASITVTPADSSGSIKKEVKYGKPTGYLELDPGRYKITYTVRNQPIMRHTFTLASGSYQTLVASGIISELLPAHPNPRTTSYKIKRIVAGAEARDPNGFQPQFIMLRDRYEGSTDRPFIRIVHAAPFKKTLTITSEKETVFEGATYPSHSDPLTVEKGILLNIKMGSISLEKLEPSTQKGHLLTILIGDPEGADSTLKISTYLTATGSVVESE